MAELFNVRSGNQDQKERGRYVVGKAESDAKIAEGEPVIFYRIGEGFSDTNESLNPQIKNSLYVNGKSASSINGFQENMPVSGERFVGDPANDLLARLGEKRAKGQDAVVVTVTVNFYEELAEKPGIYHAFRQPGTYAPESGGGGPATDPVSISGTINLTGAPTEGWFLPTGEPDATFPEMDIRDRGIFATDPQTLIDILEP